MKLKNNSFRFFTCISKFYVGSANIYAVFDFLPQSTKKMSIDRCSQFPDSLFQALYVANTNTTWFASCDSRNKNPAVSGPESMRAWNAIHDFWDILYSYIRLWQQWLSSVLTSRRTCRVVRKECSFGGTNSFPLVAFLNLSAGLHGLVSQRKILFEVSFLFSETYSFLYLQILFICIWLTLWISTLLKRPPVV
jgi:hypothetical protein